MISTAGRFAALAAFVVVTAMLTASLFVIFGQYRTGSTYPYTAVFSDVSRLKPGDSVRASGLRVGTVERISPLSEDSVLVSFTADRNVVLTAGSKAAVRYLNLVGDRYLEVADGPGSTAILAPGSQIPKERTAPALDLDLLLGGLKPVIQGLNPQDVNALSSSLLQVMQGQGATLKSILTQSDSFTNSLADRNEVIQRLIDNLNTVVATLDGSAPEFSSAIERLQRLITDFSGDRDPISTAIDSLDEGTASIAGLLAEARPPLAGVVDEFNRVAPLLDSGKADIDAALERAPTNYRKLIRLGSYGSWINYYICYMTVRVSDLQGRTAVFPIFKQETGRCTEP